MYNHNILWPLNQASRNVVSRCLCNFLNPEKKEQICSGITQNIHSSDVLTLFLEAIIVRIRFRTLIIERPSLASAGKASVFIVVFVSSVDTESLSVFGLLGVIEDIFLIAAEFTLEEELSRVTVELISVLTSA